MFHDKSVNGSRRLCLALLAALILPALLFAGGPVSPALASCAGTTAVTTETELNDAILDFNGQAGPCDYIIEFEEDITLTADLNQIFNTEADISLLIHGGGFTLDGDFNYQTFSILSTEEVTIENINVINSTNDGIRVNDSFVQLISVSVFDSLSDAVEISEGTLVVRDSTLAYSEDDGIDAYDDITSLYVINSTITGSGDDGIFVSSGNTILTHATIAGNFEGLYNEGSDVIVNNSILSGGEGDCVLDAGTIDVNFSLIQTDFVFDPCGVTDGVDGNIVGDDPLLRPLGDYGGPTQTMPPIHLGGDLSLVSPAIDAGDDALSLDENDVDLDNDQRGAGFGRVFGAEADMGAVESQGAEVVDCPAFPATVSDEAELVIAILCYNAITTPGVYTISVAANIDLAASLPAIHNDTVGVSLIIEGGSRVIDGQDNLGVRPVTVGRDTTVTINALTITGGNVTGDGGGILNEGDLTLNTVYVDVNAAEDDGGGIFNEDEATLSLNNSTVNDNQAVYPSGDGGGISNDGHMTITDSAVSGNVAEGDFDVLGGGILNEGVMVIVRSTIADNEVDAEGENALGGGIANQANLIIRDSTIHGNTADGGFDDGLGGGIYSEPDAEEVVDMGYGSQLLIINSTISDNTAESEEDPNGGGLYVTDAGPNCCLIDPVPVTLINVTLTGNRSVGDSGEVVGGGASFAQYLFGGELQVTIHNSILSDNLTDGDPGDDCVQYSDGGGVLVFESLHSLYEDTDDGACGLAAANPDADGNIVGVDPDLGALANNGGPTLTHLPDALSEAVDAGDNDLADDENGDPLAADQRGFEPRVVNGTVDMGAVEVGATPPVAGFLMSATLPGTTDDGVDFGFEDILQWDDGDWSMFFDGSAAGLAPTGKWKHNINAFHVDDIDDEDVVMSFTQNARIVPGILPKVDGMDLVKWDGSAFSLWFDGSDVGLTNKTQEKIDGLHILDGSESPIGGGCIAYLLVSTQGPGRVTKYGGGQIRFGGEDVLGFCMTNAGTATSGFWHMVLDGSAEGMPKNATDSISFSDDGQTMYLTTKGVFNVDAAAGGHSMVYEYDFGTGTFSGPVFSAPAEGLPEKVDGLQMN